MRMLLFLNFRFKSIILKILAFSTLFASQLSFVTAQNNTPKTDSLVYVISGVVLDAHSKMPISIAKVSALLSGTLVTVNDDGTFKIRIYTKDELLSISALDYNLREIALRGRDSVKIELYPNSFINYFKSVETLSGTILNSGVTNSINAFQLKSESPVITIDKEIQTQLNGNLKAVTHSGLQGIGSALFIRGLNSINSGTQPLYIVDGIVWNNTSEINSLHSGFISNPLATIDVADIESVTVLKDGTSLYGSKAANGVIIIKTKRERGLVTKITASGFGGISTTPKSIPVMNANQFRTYASDLLQLPGYDVNNTLSYFLNDDPNWPYYPRFHNNTDWQKNVYQTGNIQSYSVNLNGGDERASYTFSVGFTNGNGVLKGSDLQRLNTRFNADIYFTEKLNLVWSLDYANVRQNLVDDGVNPLTSTTFASLVKAPFLTPKAYTSVGELTSDLEDNDYFGVSNPDAIIDNSFNFNKQSRFNIGVMPSYKLLPGLTIRDNFAFTLNTTRENFYRPKIGVDSVQYLSVKSGNQVVYQQLRNINIFNDVQLIYEKSFSNYHHLNLNIGWRLYSYFDEWDYARGDNTPDDNYRRLENTQDNRADNGFNNRTRSFSNYANVEYNFKKKYLLSASVSMDASSRFGTEIDGFSFLGTKWGMFPSVNAAWLISSEPFMKNFQEINLFKFRMGYGITGNDNIPIYDNISFITSRRFIDKSFGLEIGKIANKSLKWESTGRFNVGFDANVLNDRLTVSADYFLSQTKDLLIKRKYPDYVGEDFYWSNSGEMSNRGIEVSTTAKVINSKSFKWELGLNIGTYTNKIEALPEGPIENVISEVNGGTVITQVGSAASVFYGYKTDGVYASEADALADGLRIIDKSGEHNFGAGDIRFVNLDTTNIFIDANDRQIIGDPNPDFYGSLISNFVYKRFTLNALFTYSYGNDVYNYLRSQLESGAFKYNQTTAMLQRWQSEGQVTKQPRAVLGDPMGNARFSDRWIEDGSFFKLKSLTLSYDIPVKSSFIVGLKVWASIENVFTITRYLGLDPEFSLNNSLYFQGVDFGLIPSTRSFFAGIKLNL